MLHIIQIDLHVVLGSILRHGAVEVHTLPFDGCIVLKEVPLEVRFFYNRFGLLERFLAHSTHQLLLFDVHILLMYLVSNHCSDLAHDVTKFLLQIIEGNHSIIPLRFALLLLRLLLIG